MHIILSLGIISSLLISCSNDDVVNNQEEPIIIDTIPQYDWRLEELPGEYLINMLVVDTSNIYITGRTAPLYYNGNNISQINLGFSFNSNTLGSYDNSTIYFGGSYPNPSNHKAVLVRYNNGKVDTYEVPYDSTVSTLKFDFEGPDSFWFTTTDGFDIYHFDNENFKRYKLVKRSRGGYFYRDHSQNLFLFTSRTTDSSFKNILDCYRYNTSADSFELQFSERMFEEGTDIGDKLVLCGTDLVSAGYFTAL